MRCRHGRNPDSFCNDLQCRSRSCRSWKWSRKVLNIDPQPIASVMTRTFTNRSPKRYGVALFLSRILKVKQVLITDRVLALWLKEVARYRRLCAFSDAKAKCHLIIHTAPSERQSVLDAMPRSMRALFILHMRFSYLIQSCPVRPQLPLQLQLCLLGQIVSYSRTLTSIWNRVILWILRNSLLTTSTS